MPRAQRRGLGTIRLRGVRARHRDNVVVPCRTAGGRGHLARRSERGLWTPREPVQRSKPDCRHQQADAGREHQVAGAGVREAGSRLIAAAGCRECRPCLPRTNGRGPRLCRTACDDRRFSLGARRRRRAVRGRIKGDALQTRKLAVLPDPRSRRLTRDADGERRACNRDGGRRACNRDGGRRARGHAGRRARQAGLSGARPDREHQQRHRCHRQGYPPSHLASSAR